MKKQTTRTALAALMVIGSAGLVFAGSADLHPVADADFWSSGDNPAAASALTMSGFDPIADADFQSANERNPDERAGAFSRASFHVIADADIGGGTTCTLETSKAE